MNFWTLNSLAKLLGLLGEYTGEATGISTDTRTLNPGEIYLALSGPNFDGNAFAEEAVKKGAVACILEKREENHSLDVPCFFVENPKEAYCLLASAYRKTLSCKIVGVTGSVGKTTTKEMIASALSTVCKVHKTEANLNNELGVCQTIFSIPENAQVAVIEMGMDRRGDIRLLSRIASPDVGVVTNIGVSHLAYLKTRENISREKLEITAFMPPEGILILNKDNDLLSLVESWNGFIPLTYGMINPYAEVQAKDIVAKEGETQFSLLDGEEKYAVNLPALGEHNVSNALAAYCVAKALHLDRRAALDGLKNYRPTGMRQRILSANGYTVIADCYNASPDSMQAALSVLKQMQPKGGGRRIAVLGDMLELGEAGEEAHRKMGQEAAKIGADALYLTGDLSTFAENAAKEAGLSVVEWFPNREALTKAIKPKLHAGDIILVKASHGIGLEKTVEAFLAEKK